MGIEIAHPPSGTLGFGGRSDGFPVGGDGCPVGGDGCLAGGEYFQAEDDVGPIGVALQSCARVSNSIH
jgi:hypothetical protein